jgi:hypothetical protein
MKRFRYHLKEEKRVPWHITFGRGNPFHEMHSQLGQHVKNAADEEGAGHTVVLSGTHGDIKNPLTPEQKLKHAQRAMPGVNVVVADKSAPTLLHQAANLHNNGVTDLNVHVGSDRVDEFQNLLNKYNGDHEKALYNFKNINVLPFGNDRSDDDEGAAGFSASKMRSLAALSNQNTPEGINARKMFHAMAPQAMSTKHKDEMLRDTQAGLATAAIPKPKKKKVVAEAADGTTTADVAGLVDDSGFDAMPDDVNAGFAGMVNRMADMSAMKFDQTYDPETRMPSAVSKHVRQVFSKGHGPAAAKAFARKRRSEN